MPDTVEHKSISVAANQLVCFHGFSSPFTLQHKVGVSIGFGHYLVSR
jgi:hypothetical protein